MPEPFMFIFHRGGNAISTFKDRICDWENFLLSYRGRQPSRALSWGVEGDINWLQDGGQFHFYLYHTYRIGRCIRSVTELTNKEKNGEIALISNLLSFDRLKPHYIFEIKYGIGPEPLALEKLLRTVNDLGFSQRVWFDSYSPRVLARIKEVDSGAVTSLHTSLLMGGHVLLTTPGRGLANSLTNISFMKLLELSQADIITTFIRPTSKGSTRLRKEIESFGKKTIFGGLFTTANMRNAWKSGASGGYIRFNLSNLSPSSIASW